MNLDKIDGDGRWSEQANKLNSNFNKINISIESIKDITDASHGGTIYVEKYDETDLYTALTTAMNDTNVEDYTVFDCTFFTGTALFPNSVNISKPCTILLGNITITTQGKNFFNISSNNVQIIGYGRQTDKDSSSIPNATVLVMGNASISNESTEGYHVYSKGNKNLRFEFLTLMGIRSTLGRQCDNAQRPIDGCGGIYIEKANPAATYGGNTCNNIIINQLLINGTKAHGIYLDTGILTTISNTRLSSIGGHGIFLNSGTSISLNNVYVSSANMAGFCILGVSYCTLTNCVAEYSGIGFLTRGAFNVSMFSPGCEELIFQGNNPWSMSQPVTGEYGFNIQTTGFTKDPDTGEYTVPTTITISDVSDTLYNAFAGTPFVIVGGRGISMYTPYCVGIAATSNASVLAQYSPERTCLCRIIGNARKVFINNMQGAKRDSEAAKWAEIYNDVRLEANIEGAPNGVEIIYDVLNPLITSGHGIYITDQSQDFAPVYIVPTAQNIVVRNGGTFYTGTTFAGGLNAVGISSINEIRASYIRLGNVILDAFNNEIKVVKLEQTTVVTPVTIESGSIGQNTGQPQENSNYARTADFVEWVDGMGYDVQIPQKPEGYITRLFRYDSNKDYLGYDDLNRVAPDGFSIINSYMHAGEFFKLRFETSHPEYITFNTTVTQTTETTKASLDENGVHDYTV